MPARTAPNNDVLYGWATGEDYWGGPMNDNLQLFDTVLHPFIRSMAWSSPPPDALEGDRYVVAANASGIWAGKDGRMAVLIEGVWRFYEPKQGWRAYLESTAQFVWFNGSQWVGEGDGVPADDPSPPAQAREYHVSVSIPYQPTDGEMLLMLPIIKPMVLPKDGAGSQFSALGGSPGYGEFPIHRNGVAIGKMTLNTGQSEATFAVANSVTFGAADRLTVFAPAQSIPGFKEFGFVIKFLLMTEV